MDTIVELPLLPLELPGKTNVVLPMALTILLAIGLVWLFETVMKFPLSIILTFAIQIALHKLWRKYRHDWVRQKDVVGVVMLGADNIAVNIHNGTVIQKALTNETVIKIQANGYQGKRGGRDLEQNGIITITLINKGDEPFIFKAFIANKKQYDKTITLLKKWYKKQIKIEELVTKYEYKGFLLEHNRSYSQLQQLKKEIAEMPE